jgi:hypothetical protein
MSHFRYKHTVSITIVGGQRTLFDPAGIVEGLIPALDDGVLPVQKGVANYKFWLKGDTTLQIATINFGEASAHGDTFMLRCGGEFDNRPHDVIVECIEGNIHLPDLLTLPPRMAIYLSIPDGLTVTIVGTARSDVPPPAERKQPS